MTVALGRVTSQERGRVHVWSSEPSGRYLSASLGPDCPLRGDVTDGDSLCSHSPLVCRSLCRSAPVPVVGPSLVVPNWSSLRPLWSLLVLPRLVGHLVLAGLCCGPFLCSGPGWSVTRPLVIQSRGPSVPSWSSAVRPKSSSRPEKYIDKKTPSVTDVRGCALNNTADARSTSYIRKTSKAYITKDNKWNILIKIMIK